ncbi:MAG TPA: HAD-IA family hydrolase [Bauldia sp.]|nr:HAD-IA family hydrolase [Bauldia sp.]
MSTPPTLVLDLDGTLVDTAGDLTATLNDVLAAEGLAPVPFDAARAMVGHGARAMLSNALLAAGVTAEAERLDNLVAIFLDIYGGRIAETSRPFPGAVEALDRFLADGWRLAVCTNKFERHSRLLLKALGIADRFAVIAGQDSYGVKKPDPRHLEETIRAAGGDVARAIMVGDSEVDVQTARAARVPVVAVDFGYSRIPVADLAPDRIISHFDDLFPAALQLIGATR